jgi:Ser/Thr protein kinase RdoA (MazF antagonist)
MPPANALSVLSRFGLNSQESGLERVSHGYINDTYRVSLKGRGVYILQKINTDVFPEARQVMENLVMMLPFLQGPAYAALQLEHTLGGSPWLETDSGELWRLFHYIEDSGTLESTDKPEISREAGRILGRFHQLVSDAPIEKLLIPLPRFHDLSWRALQLEQAISNGMEARVKEAEAELALSQKLIEFCREIPLSDLPVRICHNDTKLSNFLFDLGSERALCLIDLDTLMPGHLLYDFGDAARTLLNPLPESYPTRKRIRVDLNMFEPFVRGWL